MIPSPLVSEDFLRSRLALPFGKPLIMPAPYNKPFNRSISFGELPMVKGYFLGGLLKSREDFLREEEERKKKPTFKDSFNQYARENPNLFKALLSYF